MIRMICKICKHKSDNRGSTLLLVVVSMLFITLLGSLIMTLTITNQEMKVIDRKSKSNFYYVEKALDEIYAGIGTDVMGFLNTSYTDVLSNLIKSNGSGLEKITNDEANQLFLDQYFKYCKLKYLDPVVVKPLLESYIKAEAGEGSPVVEIGSITSDLTTHSVTINDLKLSYTNASGYYTSITTDIVISAPGNTVNFTNATGKDFTELFDYSLVADNAVEIQSDTDLNGNLYAGDDGITVNAPTNKFISFNALTSNIVTRGSFISKYATITIDQKLKSQQANVWADNLLTEGVFTGLGDYTKDHVMDNLIINGNCIIHDDLEVNGDGSKIKLTGSYYGFQYNGTGGVESNNDSSDLQEHKKSSSIIVNGQQTDMDLTDLKRLLIAGRAYIDLTGSSTTEATYMTGESLSVKSNQEAYLADTSSLPSNPVASGTSFTLPTGCISKTAGSLTFIYYDGLSPIAQTQYFTDYYKKSSKNRTTIQNKIDMLNVKNITIGDSTKLYSSGTVMEVVDGTVKKPSGYLLKQGANGITKSEATALSADMQIRYNFMISQLKNYNDVPLGESYLASTLTADTSETPFTYYVNESEINHLVSPYIVTMDEADELVAVLNQSDYTINPSYKKGVVISTGNVTLSDDFEGLILCKGTIKVQNSSGDTVALKSNVSLVKNIIESDTQFVNYLDDYSDYTSGGSVTDSISNIDYEDLIHYQNWRKNVD